MTPKQLSEIQQFLLSKNLPIDILMEVQDHFISHINDLKLNENLSFNDAFEITKNTWKPELRMVYDVNYSFDDISVLFKKYIHQESLRMLKISNAFAVCAIVFLFATARILEADYFFYIVLLLLIAFFIVPIINFLLYKKDFELAKKYDNYKLTFYQNASSLSLILVGSSMPLFYNLDKFSKSYYTLAYFNFNLMDVLPVFSYFFFIFLNCYCFLNQRNYLRQIQKVKPFLENLTTSS